MNNIKYLGFRSSLRSLSLHIRKPPDEEKASGLTPTSTIIDGLHKLAAMLVKNPRFADTKEIVAFSWVVAKNPHLLERLGFHIATDKTYPLYERLERAYLLEKKYSHLKDLEPNLATITREEFLERYGSLGDGSGKTPGVD